MGFLQRIEFMREYFEGENRAKQIELLNAVLQKIETNTCGQNSKLFQELNSTEFIQLEFSRNTGIESFSKQKNNLLVRLLQDFTTYDPSHLKLMGATNFMNRMYEIYNEGGAAMHTKCSWKLFSCSQACVLRTLCNITRTASTKPEMLKHLQRLNFLPKLCIVHEMCSATAWSALILLDNLMQRVEVASLLFTMLPKAEFFNCVLAYMRAPLPEMDTSAERKRYFEFKQCLQSIIINLSREKSAYAMLFEFSQFAFPKAMVSEIIAKTDYMHHALVSLCIFASNNSHATFMLCQRILDSLLSMSTGPRVDVQVKMNAIKLLAVFFGTRELSCQDSQWICKLQRGARSGNADVGMWSTLCLALLGREHIPANVSEDILETLVVYLDIVNIDDSFPCNMIFNVMQWETRNLLLLRKHGLKAHLHISLESAFANSNTLVFLNALQCLEVCTGETKQVLLQEFSRKFATSEERVALLKELLMQCGLGEEPTIKTTTTPSSPKRLHQPHVLDYMPRDSQEEEEEEKLDEIQEVDFAPGDISECERDAYTVHALHLISREELKLFVLERLTLQVLREISPQDSTNILLSLGFSQQSTNQLIGALRNTGLTCI